MGEITERLGFTYMIVCTMVVTFLSIMYILDTITNAIGANVTAALLILITFIVLFIMSGD